MSNNLRKCWYKTRERQTGTSERIERWNRGLFHQWGAEPAGLEGDGYYTVGIIEDADMHVMHTPSVTWVSFADEKPDE